MYCPTCKETYANGAFCAKDGTALVVDAPTNLVGQVLADRYRIVRLLGEGGMGQVYEAQHLNINKRFAIKMLKPEVIGSAQSLQRFRQEAWAASSIGHDHIVEIDDFATLPSGQVYLAMEFLDGQSLAERLRDEAPIPIADAVAVAIAVGHGLGAAHDKGIVHRDMKPENVFLARKGGRVVAKILDFGIAKMTGGDEPSNLTRTGAIFGTPLYMSPEQAKGKPADARADIYALGVILYEELTGSVPFGGDSSVEILSQHIGAKPVPPSEVAPERGIPPALEALVLRALEKEPAARFASMADFVRELESVAASLPAPDLAKLVTAPPAPPTGWNAQLRTPTPGASTPRPNASTPTPAAATPRSNASTPTPSASTPTPAAGTPTPRASTPTPDAGTPRPKASTPTPDAGTARPSASTPPPKAATPSMPRPAARTPPGPMATPHGAADSRAALSQPAGAADTLGALEPARSHGARNALLALLALALVGGGVWLLVLRPRGEVVPLRTEVVPSGTSSQPTPPAPPTPAPKRAVEVIVDSTPTGAKIVRDGVTTAETPEALELTGPTTLVLRKDGWADKSVTIDPAAEHKIVVKLERARAPKPPSPTKVAAPAPPAPPAKPPVVAATKPKPGEPVDPYAPAQKPPAPPKPPAVAPTPRSHDELSARVEKQGASAVPAGHRLGAIYRGAAASEGGRSDWFVDLEGGHCYTFVGEGGDGVQKLYLYLWGPRGRRLTSTREDTPHAKMTYCTAFPGNYHFQAKVDDGEGEYRVGIFYH